MEESTAGDLLMELLLSGFPSKRKRLNMKPELELEILQTPPSDRRPGITSSYAMITAASKAMAVISDEASFSGLVVSSVMKLSKVHACRVRKPL